MPDLDTLRALKARVEYANIDGLRAAMLDLIDALIAEAEADTLPEHMRGPMGG